MDTPYDTRLPPHLRSLKEEIEGYAREYLCINGQWQDHLLYARLRDSPRR